MVTLGIIGLDVSDSIAIGCGVGGLGSTSSAGDEFFGGSTLAGAATGPIDGNSGSELFLLGGIGGAAFFCSVPAWGTGGSGGTGGGAADSSPPGICGSTFCRLSMDSFNFF